MTLKVSEFDAECLIYYGERLTGEFAHWCVTWNQLPIDESCPEFAICDCDFGPRAETADSFRLQRQTEIVEKELADE